MTDLSTLGATALGVWTRRQALLLLRPGQVDGLVRTGTWQVLWRGVYADGGYEVTAEQRGLAAVLATGAEAAVPPGPGRTRLRAAACGRLAARVWQLPLIDDDDPATGACEHLIDDVAVDRHIAPQTYDKRRLIPRQPRLGRSDLVRLSSGLWLTTPLRTLVDCAALLQPEALVCAMDAALHREQVSTVALELAAHARGGARGAPTLRNAVERADGRAESPAETLARLLLLPVLPGFEPQVRLLDAAARVVARFDLADRAVRLAVESDGVRGHAGAQMVAKDRRRDRRSEALGWTTERVRWFELRREQETFVRRIRARHAELRRAAA